MRFFVGGYSPELFMAELDQKTGAIELVGSVSTPENASFMTLVPGMKMLYATVETGYKTGQPGKVIAYRVDKGGTLTAMGSAQTCGAGPCHLDVDPSRKLLAVANYGGRTFSLISLAADGTPGEQVACVTRVGSSVNVHRQREPHPHSTTFSPDGRFLLVCDLGTDTIDVYPVDKLSAGESDPVHTVAATPGSGPRHLAFSPDSSFVCVVNELSNTVAVYRYGSDDAVMEMVQEISTLPNGVSVESLAAEIAIDSTGRFVYASNRGHDSITVFDRDASTGEIQRRGYIGPTGAGPRHFSIDPSGTWLVTANQDADSVVSFRLNPETGQGSWSGREVKVTAPSCVVFAG